jgi:hypothetical protein
MNEAGDAENLPSRHCVHVVEEGAFEILPEGHATQASEAEVLVKYPDPQI